MNTNPLYVNINRWQMLLIWLCLIPVVVLLMAVMLIDCLPFGRLSRAAYMAVAMDECANAAFGGDPRVTVSARVGNGLVSGAPWAPGCARIIDALFGKGHCLSQADKYQE